MAGGADFDKVSLLLHFDGADASTTFVDSSGTPKTVTAFGSAALSTSRSKFGGASILFDGSGDYLSIPNTPALNFQDDVALTIEAWVYVSAHGGSEKTVFGNYGWVDSTNYTQASLIVASDGRLRALFGAQDVYSTQTVPTGQFAHIALSVSSTQIVFSVNGSTSTITRTEFSLPAYLGSHFIGAIQGFSAHTLFFSGYIDELRITKGVARYTADFTPPSAPFPDVGINYDISGTVRDATGALAARKVAAYREDTNAFVAATTSDATTGVYSIETADGTAHTLVFYPALGENLNALVRRGVLPIET